MLRKLLVLTTALCACAAAQASKSILLITDAEGVAGICRQEQTEPTNPELQKLLAGEINAAIRGFNRAGGADVVVWDGHDGSRTLSALQIEGGRLVIGALGPRMLLERKFSAIAFIGQHARANRERAVMAHSYSSQGIQKLLMNGKEVGEIETRSALAGWYNTPVILLTGDQAATEDLHAIVPQAVTVAVKEGVGYYACISDNATTANMRIEAGAYEALRKLSQIPPYRIEGPVEIIQEATTRSTPSPDAVLLPGVEHIGPRTTRFRGKDFMEAWTLWAGR
ncbi:M55 family metallopeptidase [Paludibaculum fermentans]|uniref:M55 family metallopeptidase n=1 Tax=Paludibaculum fermentans TaxID=1473598 RepID=A0A7S7NQT0_PALFE|nr:M55 family metallopeptidase [Paludibaculum fermentans]QOY88098.1 M55 family metallopeptidase [Paludibaculum fermentans]